MLGGGTVARLIKESFIKIGGAARQNFSKPCVLTVELADKSRRSLIAKCRPVGDQLSLIARDSRRRGFETLASRGTSIMTLVRRVAAS